MSIFKSGIICAALILGVPYGIFAADHISTGVPQDLEYNDSQLTELNKFGFGESYHEYNNCRVQTAQKSFYNNAGRRVILLGISHVGNKNYYEDIQKTIEGFEGKVLYEAFGEPLSVRWANIKKISGKVNVIKPNKVIRFHEPASYLRDFLNGKVSQSECFFLCGLYELKKCIRADMNLDHPILKEYDLEEFTAGGRGSQTCIEFFEKNYIDDCYKTLDQIKSGDLSINLLNSCINEMEKRDTPEARATLLELRHLLNNSLGNDDIDTFFQRKYLNHLFNWYNFVYQRLKQAAIKSGIDSKYPEMNQTSTHPIHIARNKIVIDIMTEVLRDFDVLVMYGAEHMMGPEGIEASLKTKGFLPGTVIWR